MSVSTWLDDHAAVKRHIMNDRANGVMLTSKEWSNLTNMVNNLDLKLTKELKSQELIPSELARREVLMNNLQRQLKDIKIELYQEDDVMQNVESIGSHLGQGSLSSPSGSTITFEGNGNLSRGAGYHHAPSWSNNKASLSNAGLEQKMVIQASTENDLLSEISGGVSRMKATALSMRDESSLHDSLLDDFDYDVDQTAYALYEEAQRSKKLREQTMSTRLYLCLGVEVIVIIILLILMGQ
jgi:hypothetical protein